MGKQQERAAEWEAAAQEEEAAITHRRQVSTHCCLPLLAVLLGASMRRQLPFWQECQPYPCPPTTLSALHAAPAVVQQEVEGQEQRLQRRTEELSAVERRIAAAQQRLDSEAERLKRAVAAVEEEGAALKASLPSAWEGGWLVLLGRFC